MKHIIFFLLISASLAAQEIEVIPVEPNSKYYERYFADNQPEQKPAWKWNTKAYKYTIPLMAGSGALDGLNQTLNFHYRRFKEVFPRARNQFWDPAISWENKYAKDGAGNILTQYEAFPFATNALVFVTDGHHLTRAGDRVMIYGALALNIGERKNWKDYTLDVLVHSLARSIGFNAVYSIWMK